MASKGWRAEATSCKSLHKSGALKFQVRMPDLGCRNPTVLPSKTTTKCSIRCNPRAQCGIWNSTKPSKLQWAPTQKPPLTLLWHRWLRSQYRRAVLCQGTGQHKSTGTWRQSGQGCSCTATANEVAPCVRDELDTGSSPSASTGLPESPHYEGASVPAYIGQTRTPLPAHEARISLDEILASPESTLHHCLKDNEKHDSKQGTLGKSAEGKDGKREAGDLCEPGTSFEVREAASEEELLAAAWMRADVYADGLPYTRFVDSYRKQFAEQEFGSLLKRTKAQTGRHLRCCCLVAVDPTALAASYPASDYVIGTLDVSLKQLMPGERIAGEETSEESVTFAGKRPVTKARKYVYISNVCVPERARRRGIAAQMMGAAALVVKEWGFSEVFCHVEVDNRGAQELYKKLGYEKYGEVVVQETVSGAHVSLRRTLLLRAELDML